MKNRIGIVGGGQLARMLTFDAKKMGFTVTVLDPTPNSPGGQVADKQIIADLNDEKAMMALAENADYITLDWELANPDILEQIEKKGIPVNPSPKTLRIIKDKYQQKVFLQKHTIPVAPFVAVKTEQDIKNVVKKFGYPFLLKAKLGAYDGKGNYLVKRKKDITKAFEKLGREHVYAERFIPFVKELAIMIARSTTGEIKTFPVVETIHKNNILHMTIAPAPVQKKIAKKVEKLAKKVMNHLQGAGVFGIEMFLTKDGKILINEIAPRVHNSGHYTIEACITSQFEQHIRAVTGMPLGKTDMLRKSSVMINILGDRTGKTHVQGIENVLALPGVTPHVYGKTETKQERKMGHITVIGKNLTTCIAYAKKARKLLTI
jgi:5-(carboxyamino)imidazole ribonucleotide synthase